MEVEDDPFGTVLPERPFQPGVPTWQLERELQHAARVRLEPQVVRRETAEGLESAPQELGIDPGLAELLGLGVELSFHLQGGVEAGHTRF